VQSLRRCGSNNPVFLLDEIDKLGRDYRGDPSAALLEALDPEQNAHFSDHYLEVGFDLSKVLFITTANVLHTIPPPLVDRMEVLQIPGYLDHEKLAIARRFLLPKQIRATGLAPDALQVTDTALEAILHRYTREAGVRNLEREIGRLCRKVARQVAGAPAAGRKNRAPADAVQVDHEDVARWLSVAPYNGKQVSEGEEIGVATGLAWTATGGEILPIEVSLMNGKGDLILTGQLGDIMKESARAALSWVRSASRRLGIKPEVFDRSDVHVHVPEGAIPKDGPSAGIAIAVAIASVASGVAVDRRIAMTGEITLRGKALAVGGLNEKAVAALRAGVRTILVPHDNAKDLHELPAFVRAALEVVPVRDMEDVLARTLGRDLRPRARQRARPRPRVRSRDGVGPVGATH